MVKKYVKKRIPVEAIQYDGSNFDEVQDFCPDAFVEDGFLKVRTLEGVMSSTNKTGDFVMKGIHGEFYICERNIFEESYEEYTEEDKLEYVFEAPTDPYAQSICNDNCSLN